MLLVFVLLFTQVLRAAEYKLSEEPPPESIAEYEDTEISLMGEFRRDPRVIFRPIDEWRKTKGPFLRDGQIKYNFRTYYFDGKLPDESEPKAWAVGGQLDYNSGVWRDTVAIGASWYSAFDLSSNSDASNSRLFSDTGNDVSIIGQAYVDFYWQGVTARFFRQELDLPYINRFDNRMNPNAFEAYGVGKDEGNIQFVLAQVTKIKFRDGDKFVRMGEAAGVEGSDAGVTMAGAKWESPAGNYDIGFINQYTRNIFNTAYAEANWKKQFNQNLGLNISGQFTDQRSVGDNRAGDFDTDTWGVRMAGSYRFALLTFGFTQTDSGAAIRSPYGGRPTYLSMMIRNFDRANEKAWRVGLSYHFKRFGWPDLSTLVNVVKGRKARDPLTGEKLPDQTEYDYTLDYKPSSGPLEGFWFRTRYAKVREAGAGKVTDEIRVIVNYTLPIL
ncbi:MAG: OprD family outer membrane porin [Gammaproteobacteria bacterium]